jgi:hypothetical protein
LGTKRPIFHGTIGDIEQAMREFRDRIIERPDLVKLREQIDRHWDKLFREPLSVAIDGEARQIAPQRTNNILEHHIRHLAQRQRRRTGFELSARRLNQLLPGTPLLCNLGNPSYEAILLDGAKDFAERFGRIPIKTVRGRLAAAQTSPFKRPTKAQHILESLKVPLYVIRRALDLALARLDARPVESNGISVS